MTYSVDSFGDISKNDELYFEATEDARTALIGVKELYIITQELRRKIQEIEELKSQVIELNNLTQYLFKYQQQHRFCHSNRSHS